MRSILSAAALLFAGICSAQGLEQSKPFNLVVVSDDETLNGTFLNSCHTGAAIESLCTYKSDNPSVYNVNYTAEAVNASDARGTLTWTLVGGNFVLSQPLVFSYTPSSNVALPLFEPSSGGIQVFFNDKHILGIESYVDDTTDPATILNPARVYYRWYLCVVYYAGYQYQDLAWVQGAGEPQNPRCKKVDVERRFV